MSRTSSPLGQGITVWPSLARPNGCGVRNDFPFFSKQLTDPSSPDFVVSHQTLLIEEHLGFKFFFMFGTVNIGAMAIFSLLIPETKGRSLEEMDVIFGTITEEKRQADVARAEQKGGQFIRL